MQELSDGSIIQNQYQIIKRIWKSDFGNIYLGVDQQNFSRHVIIKEPFPQLLRDNAFIERFIDEAKILSKLHHPNIPRFYELVKDPHPHYLIMEYVHGINLSNVLTECQQQGKTLASELGAYIALETVKALEYSHEQGLCHRDVNPTNVMVSFEGNIKLIDFGVAKGAFQRNKGGDKGFLIGKIRYMSPEQIRGREVDARSDVYSFGVTLFELLSGRPLFEEKDKERLISQILDTKIDKRVFEAEIPGEFKELIIKITQKNPERRVLNAQEIHNRIEEYIHSQKSRNLHHQLRDFLKELCPDTADALPQFAPDKGGKQKKKQASDAEDEESRPGLSPEGAGDESGPTEEEKTIFERAFHYGRRHIEIIKKAVIGLLIAFVLWSLADASLRISPYGRAVYDIIKPPSLRVQTTPEGATVLIDGKAEAGTTPLRVDRLAPGVHAVVCRLNGFQPIEEAVEIPARQKTILYAKSFKREIEVLSNPPGADIIVCGQIISARTPCRLQWSVDQPFELELAMQGFSRIADFSLDFMEDKAKYKDRRIWKFASDSSQVRTYQIEGHFYKEVRFESSPRDAFVYIDGEMNPAQRTGQNVLLTVGRHRVEMRPANARYSAQPLLFDLDIDRNTPFRVYREFRRRVTLTARNRSGQELQARVLSVRPEGRSSFEPSEATTPYSVQLLFVRTEVDLRMQGYQDTTVTVPPERSSLQVVMGEYRGASGGVRAQAVERPRPVAQPAETPPVEPTRVREEPASAAAESGRETRVALRVSVPGALPLTVCVLDEADFGEISNTSVFIRKARSNDSFELAGTTDSKGMHKFFVYPGVYEIRLEKDGYDSIVRQHEISKDRGAEPLFQMTRKR